MRVWHVVAGTVMAAGVAVGVSAVDIAVNGSSEQQTIDGFGSSVMNWMTSVYGNTTNRTNYAQDLGCSVVRGELHPQAITKNNCMNLNPTTFGADIDANVALMDFNQSRVAIVGGFMQAVYNQKIDDMKIMLSIWTPPDWMKTNSFNGDPGCQSYGGHLTRTEANRTNFARYTAAYIKGFSQRYQIPVYNLSMQNELDWAHAPSSWTTSCQYFSTTYPTGTTRTNNGPALGVNDYNVAVRFIYNELRANNIPMKFFGPEKSHIFQNIYNLGQHMSYIKDMSADGTMDIMDGFCHHGYALTPGNRTIIGQYWNGNTSGDPNINFPGIKTFNKPSWQTEAIEYPLTWAGAMSFARNIHDELVAGNLSAYVNWCYASDGAGDNYALVISSTVKTDKYHVMKHFSRYIRPGSRRLPCTPDNGAGLSVSAYRHSANGTLTFVCLNAGTAGETANITLPPAPEGVSSFQVFTSQSGNVWATSSATVTGGRVSVPVPANGIVTLYGQGQTKVQPRSSELAPSTPAFKPSRASLTIPRNGENGESAGVTVSAYDRGLARLHDLRGRLMMK